MSYRASRDHEELRARAEAQLERLELPADVDLEDIVRQRRVGDRQADRHRAGR